MALMTWNDSYSVGVNTLDKQHLVLVDTLNELHGAMMKGQGKTVVADELRKLVEYTRDHFSTEERMMTATGFPGLAEHRARHQELTKQVAEFVGRYERGEVTMNVQLLNFLRDWLMTHILKEDHQYGPWLTQHGVR